MVVSAQQSNTLFQFRSNSTVLLSDEVRGIILKNRFCQPLSFLDCDSADNIRLEFERLSIRTYATLFDILNKLPGQPCLRLGYRTNDHRKQHEPSIAIFLRCRNISECISNACNSEMIRHGAQNHKICGFEGWDCRFRYLRWGIKEDIVVAAP